MSSKPPSADDGARDAAPGAARDVPPDMPSSGPPATSSARPGVAPEGATADPSCGIPGSPPPPRARRRLRVGTFRDLLPDHLAIDVRALAAFRIGLGVLLLADLALRAPHLVSFQTDQGVLPRSALIGLQNPFHLSLHMMSGEAWFQVVLLLVAAVAAVALAAGVRTRLATVVCWVLLASLHARNPMVLQSGDVLLRLYLFWGMLLPLGAVASVDRALDRGGADPPTRVRTVPAFALLLQVVLVYLTTALLKSDTEWLAEGSAIRTVLMLEPYVTDLGRRLLEFPELLRWATWGTLALEIVPPLLLLTALAGDRMRVAVVALFMGFHGSFLLLMTLGLFPWISMLGWVVFLPSSFWDGVARRLRSPLAGGVTIHYDRDCTFCVKMLRIVLSLFALPEVRTRPAQDVPEVEAELRARNSWLVDTHDGRRLDRFEALAYLASISRPARPIGWLMSLPGVRSVGRAAYTGTAARRPLASRLFRVLPWHEGSWETRRGTEIAALLLLGYVVAWNAAGMQRDGQLPDGTRWVGHLLRIEQRWSMFSPRPFPLSGVFEARGMLADGREMDLTPTVRHARAWSAEPQGGPRGGLPSYRWRKFGESLWRDPTVAPAVVESLCSAWRRERPEEPALEHVELAFPHRRVLPLAGRYGSPLRPTIHEGACDAGGGPVVADRAPGEPES